MYCIYVLPAIACQTHTCQLPARRLQRASYRHIRSRSQQGLTIIYRYVSSLAGMNQQSQSSYHKLHKQASSTSSPGLAVLCCRWAALPWLWPLPAAGFVPLEEAWDGVPLHKTSVRDKLQSSNSIRIYLVSIMHLVGLLKSSSRSQRFANSQMIRV